MEDCVKIGTHNIHTRTPKILKIIHFLTYSLTSVEILMEKKQSGVTLQIRKLDGNTVMRSKDQMKKAFGVKKELFIEVNKLKQDLVNNAKIGIQWSHINQITTQLTTLMQDLISTYAEIQTVLVIVFGVTQQIQIQDGNTVVQSMNLRKQ